MNHQPAVSVYTVVRTNDVGCERCGCRKQAPGLSGLCTACIKDEHEKSIQQAIEAIENE